VLDATRKVARCRIVLRLSDEELLALIALAEPGETLQATLRRLLASAARKRPKR
jgi:hypothetical protein